VNVSLKTGLVSITLKPGNTVRIDQIRKAILDDAFTPKDARVAVVGDLVSQDGKLRFKVAGTNEVFPVGSTPHAAWQKQSRGKPLLVNGLISEPANRAGIGTLQITSASGAPPPDKGN
jgi:hypothetical protein